MSSRLATFILIPTHKGNREAVRPLPSNVKRPHASQNISPGTFPKTEISFREFRVFVVVKRVPPDAIRGAHREQEVATQTTNPAPACESPK